MVTQPCTIMEVCGGQTHTLVRQGIDEVMISISHCRTHATAQAVAVGKSRGAAE